jgi:hypothetical protein
VAQEFFDGHIVKDINDDLLNNIVLECHLCEWMQGGGVCIYIYVWRYAAATIDLAFEV